MDNRVGAAKHPVIGMLADGLGRKVARQDGPAAETMIRTMIDNAIEILAHRSTVTFVARLGTTGFGLVPTLLAISRWRLGRCTRGLLRSLHPQPSSINSSLVSRCKSPRSIILWIQLSLPWQGPG